MIKDCPNHEGHYDCTPFCRICEGNQEYGLPDHINVMKVVTYDVQRICEDIQVATEKSIDEITIEDCLDWISDWVQEDFGGSTNLIYQDENGNEL